MCVYVFVCVGQAPKTENDEGKGSSAAADTAVPVTSEMTDLAPVTRKSPSVSPK